ncbi:Leucine-rich receptor-like protein kinase family protein [Prunus dulcis]|uniref:Leucine-rich receptor-like protein kinase family protein n=1 Tax=Prunus dulcis TaxID=3755 RepID=A0A4Y1R399_PRUDU|nr:Leucine-rich receptor-like protein kinase family protein [Prunus dulcis]
MTLSGVLTGPIRGVGCTGVWGDYVEILGNVQFIGETLPKFRQKVSVFSKWARHRGDVGISKGVVSGLGKFGRVLSRKRRKKEGEWVERKRVERNSPREKIQ